MSKEIEIKMLVGTLALQQMVNDIHRGSVYNGVTVQSITQSYITPPGAPGMVRVRSTRHVSGVPDSQARPVLCLKSSADTDNGLVTCNEYESVLFGNPEIVDALNALFPTIHKTRIKIPYMVATEDGINESVTLEIDTNFRIRDEVLNLTVCEVEFTDAEQAARLLPALSAIGPKLVGKQWSNHSLCFATPATLRHLDSIAEQMVIEYHTTKITQGE